MVPVLSILRAGSKRPPRRTKRRAILSPNAGEQPWALRKQKKWAQASESPKSNVDTLSFSDASESCKGTLGTVLGQFGDVHSGRQTTIDVGRSLAFWSKRSPTRVWAGEFGNTGLELNDFHVWAETWREHRNKENITHTFHILRRNFTFTFHRLNKDDKTDKNKTIAHYILEKMTSKLGMQKTHSPSSLVQRRSQFLIPCK